MKTFKTIISIVFIVGAIAIIVYDGQTEHNKTAKDGSIKKDSSSHSTTK